MFTTSHPWRQAWSSLILCATIGLSLAAAPQPSEAKPEVVPGDGKANEVPAAVQAHARAVSAVAVSRDGKRYATACGLEEEVKLWNAETGALIATLGGLPDAEEVGGCDFLQFTPDGEQLIVRTFMGEIYRWSLKTNAVECAVKFDVGRQFERGYVFSNDGQHRLDLTVRAMAACLVVRDVSGKAEPVELYEFPQASIVNYAEFSPDDEHLLAVYSDDARTQTVRVWNWREGKSLWQQEFDKGPYAAAITPDGKRVLVVTQHALPPGKDDVIVSEKLVGKLVTYDLATGEELGSKVIDDLVNLGEIWSFSADRQWLLAAHFLRDAEVYDVATGKRAAAFPMKALQGYARVGGLSPESQLLVLGDASGMVYTQRLALPVAVVKKPASEAKPPPPAMLRTWSSADGRFTVKARLLGFADGQVELERNDGKKIVVPLEKLSAADKKYVEASK